MRTTNPEFIIKIIVQARNEIAGVMARAASEVDKVTGAQNKQGESIDRVTKKNKDLKTSVESLQQSYGDFTKEVEKGSKSADEAVYHLERYRQEFDKLAKQAPVGSQLAGDLNATARGIEGLTTKIKAETANREKIEKDYTDFVAREEAARLSSSVRRSEAETKADSAATAQRKKEAQEIVDFVHARDAEQQANMQRLGDEEVKEAARVESMRADSRRQRAAAEAAADRAVSDAKQRLLHDQIAADGASAESTIKQTAAIRDQREELQGAVRDYESFIDSVRRGEVAGQNVKVGLQQHASVLQNQASRATKTFGPGSDEALVIGASALEAKTIIKDLDKDTEHLGKTSQNTRGFLSRLFNIDTSGLDRTKEKLDEFEKGLDKSGFSAVKLAGNIRGTIIIAALTFFQQLAGAAVALGGALLSIASAAVQAGTALAGIAVAGVAQALPVIGLLAAAWGRVGAVYKTFQEHEKAQLKSSADSTAALNRQVSAAQAVANATKALTKAREEAVRQLQDLIDAEKRSILQQQDAKKSLQTAISTGDVEAQASAELSVHEADITASRARVDAHKATKEGVGGNPSVESAQQSLDDAKHSAAEASKELNTTQNQLKAMLGELDPVETKLYEALVKVRGDYKKIFSGTGGVTDIILKSFIDAVDRVDVLLHDKRLVDAARSLAAGIADQVKRITDFLTDKKNQQFFTGLAEQAKKNLPLVVTLVEDLLKFLRTVATAAAPALHTFLGFLDDLGGKADKATGSASGIAKLERFFNQGERFAETFIKLGDAIGRLFLAVIGDSAKQGGGAIEDLTKKIDEATHYIETHQKQVKKFFDEAIEASKQVVDVLGEVGAAIFELFKANEVKAFAEGFKDLLPIISNTFKTLGKFITVLEEIASTPAGKALLELGAYALILDHVFKPLFKIIGFGVTILEALGGEAEAGAIGLGILEVATGPVGLAIAAVIATVLILNSKFHFLGATVAWLKTAFSDVVDWLSHHWPLVLYILTGPFGIAVTLIVKHFDAIKGAVEDAFDFIKEVVSKVGGFVIDQVEEFAKNILALVPSPFKKIGRAMADGLVSGFKTLVNFFKDIGVWLFDNVIKPIYEFFEIKSPSGVFEKIGGNLIEGLIKGIEGLAGDLSGFMIGLGKSLVKDIVSGITSLPGSIYNAIKNSANGGGHSFIESIPVVGSVVSLFGGGSSHKSKKTAGQSTTPVPLSQLYSATEQALFKKSWSAFWSSVEGVAEVALQAIQKQFREMRVNSNSTMALMYKEVKSHIHDIQTEFLEGSQVFVDTWASAFFSIQKITGDGLKYITDETNSVLKGLSTSKIDFGLKAPVEDSLTVKQGKGHATGGFIGTMGERGKDAVHAVLGRGEAVLNWGHQKIVNSALWKSYGTTLGDMFKGMRGTHAGTGYAEGGFVADPGTNFSVGEEPVIVSALKRLAQIMRTTIYGISGYRSPQHSVEVGGFADDPHTRGEAADIGVGANTLASAARLTAALLARVGLERPFWPANAHEINHVQLLGSGASPGASLTQAISEGPLAGAAEAVRKIMAPTTHGSGPMHAIVEGIFKRVASAANKTLGGGGVPAGSASDAAGLVPGILKIAKQAAAINKVPWVESIVRTLLGKESAGGENEPPSGSLSATGPFQVIPSTFAANAFPGHGDINNPYDNALAAFHYIRDTYHTLQNLAAKTGLFGGNYQGYNYGGPVQGSGTGDTVAARLTPGEHVWTASEVARAGGHAAMYAMRKIFGGGRQGGPSTFASGGAVFSVPGLLATGSEGASISSLVSEIKKAQRYIQGLATKDSSFIKDAYLALGPLTTQGGLLDQLSAQITSFSTNLATKLLLATYRVTKSKGVIERIDAVGVAERSLQDLQKVLVDLVGERGDVQRSLDEVSHRISELERGGITKDERPKYEKLVGVKRLLQKRVDTVAEEVASNAQAQFQAIETAINAQVEAANTAATNSTAGIEVRGKLRALLGGTFLTSTGAQSNEAIGQERAGVLGSQAATLEAAKAYALSHGRGDMATTIGNQIAELQAQAQEAVEAGLSADVEEITRQATRKSASLELRSRIATALGNVSEVGSIVTEQISAIGQQVEELKAKAADAGSKGYYALQEEIQEKVEELQSQMVEKAAQHLQGAVEEVETAASKKSTVLDLQDRVSALVQGAGNYALAYQQREATLQERGSNFASQRNAFYGLLGTAQSEGNQGQIESLTAKIKELEVELQENTAAIASNTIAARQAAIDAITGRSSFLSGIYGNLGSILTGLGAISGATDVEGQKKLVQQTLEVLGTAGQGLAQQLLQDFGVDLTGQGPAELVQSLQSLNYDGIEANFSVEQKTQFEALINAVIDNATATVSNTQQLQELSSTMIQSFSTTAWREFRSAIFNGNGQLLSQYQVPSLAGGATILSDGMVHVHRGEEIVAANVDRRGGSGGEGDFIAKVEVTEQVQEANPDVIANRLLYRYRNRPKS